MKYNFILQIAIIVGKHLQEKPSYTLNVQRALDISIEDSLIMSANINQVGDTCSKILVRCDTFLPLK